MLSVQLRAARHGKIQFVDPLLDFRSAGLDIDAQNACGRTALHLAVHTLREAIVIRLLEAGADANVTDIAGDAPMHVACKVSKCNILIFNISLCAEFLRRDR